MTDPNRVGVLRRGWEITLASTKYFILYRISPYRRASLGTRIRLACEELGLVFIKLGQILSTRYDLLDRPDCEELQKLLDEVPPFSYEAVRDIFIVDFGKPPEEIFEEFNSAHIASASIAQVYKARVRNGQSVAVKVRRPGVERAIRSDLQIFKFLARVTSWFSSDLRHIDLQNILGQLESWLMAEVDFENEVKNVKSASGYYRTRTEKPGSEYARNIVFPDIHDDLSSKNVITMTFIEGVPMRHFKTLENNPEYDAYESIKNLTRTVVRAWINEEELYFHADPHPSNLIFLPHGRIALLDFGLLGKFDGKDIRETRELFLALYAKNVDEALRLSLRMCGVGRASATQGLREDVAAYIQEAEFTGLGYWFMGFARLLVKHRVPFPYQIVLFGRCHMLIDGLFEMVTPGRKALEIIGEELERGLRKQMWRNIQETNFTPILWALSEKMKKSPELVAGLIDKYFDDPLQLIRDFKKAVRI